MSVMASQITSVPIVYLAVCSAHDCLLNRLFGRRSKKTSKFRVTGLCEGNSPVTGEFTAQSASNAKNVHIWWRHHITHYPCRRKGIHWSILHDTALSQQVKFAFAVNVAVPCQIGFVGWGLLLDFINYLIIFIQLVRDCRFLNNNKRLLKYLNER